MIGHILHDLEDAPAMRSIDDRHELRGREWLSRRFGEDVTFARTQTSDEVAPEFRPFAGSR